MTQFSVPNLKESPILEVTYDNRELVKVRGNHGYSYGYLLSSAEDKWLFPNRPVSIDTGISIRIPDNTIALATGSPWILEEDGIIVHPQIFPDDSNIYLTISSVGILPKKLKKGTYIGILTIISNVESELIQHRNNEDDLE